MTETWPKNSNWFEFVGLRRLDFEAEMASSYDGVCPRDLLRRRNTRYKNPQLVDIVSLPVFVDVSRFSPCVINLTRNKNICCGLKKCGALIG